MGTIYTVSDGKLMLTLEPAEEGGYIVTSPLDPQLVTQAETLEEAFLMAYDVRELLIQGRAELARQLLGSNAIHTARGSVNQEVISASEVEPSGSPTASDMTHGRDDEIKRLGRAPRPRVTRLPGERSPKTS